MVAQTGHMLRVTMFRGCWWVVVRERLTGASFIAGGGSERQTHVPDRSQSLQRWCPPGASWVIRCLVAVHLCSDFCTFSLTCVVWLILCVFILLSTKFPLVCIVLLLLACTDSIILCVLIEAISNSWINAENVGGGRNVPDFGAFKFSNSTLNWFFLLRPLFSSWCQEILVRGMH